MIIPLTLTLDLRFLPPRRGPEVRGGEGTLFRGSLVAETITPTSLSEGQGVGEFMIILPLTLTLSGLPAPPSFNRNMRLPRPHLADHHGVVEPGGVEQR
jgi:hypothetical protein